MAVVSQDSFYCIMNTVGLFLHVMPVMFIPLTCLAAVHLSILFFFSGEKMQISGS